MFCKNCGKEYEGNYCPYCGASAYRETECPKCGRKRGEGELYCRECGYKFDRKRFNFLSGKTTIKIYSLLYLMPAIIFFLFVGLLFAFYAAPLAITPATKIAGEIIPAESLGNIYSIVKEYPDAKNSILALIIFTLLCLVLSVVVIARGLRRRSRIETSGVNKTPKIYALYYIEAAITLVFFVIGIVIVNKIKKEFIGEDDEFGDLLGEIVKVGSCPKLVIAFSIVSLILMVGCMFARTTLLRYNRKCLLDDYVRAVPPKKIVQNHVILPVKKECMMFSKSFSARKSLIAIVLLLIPPVVITMLDLTIIPTGGYDADDTDAIIKAMTPILIQELILSLPVFLFSVICSFRFSKVRFMKVVAAMFIVGIVFTVIPIIMSFFAEDIGDTVSYIASICLTVGMWVIPLSVVANFLGLFGILFSTRMTNRVLRETNILPEMKARKSEIKSQLKECSKKNDEEGFNAVLGEIHNSYVAVKEGERQNIIDIKNAIAKELGA